MWQENLFVGKKIFADEKKEQGEKVVVTTDRKQPQVFWVDFSYVYQYWGRNTVNSTFVSFLLRIKVKGIFFLAEKSLLNKRKPKKLTLLNFRIQSHLVRFKVQLVDIYRGRVGVTSTFVSFHVRH